jgi:hypothetical protein
MRHSETLSGNNASWIGFGPIVFDFLRRPSRSMGEILLPFAPAATGMLQPDPIR